jgi:hypothetical protein
VQTQGEVQVRDTAVPVTTPVQVPTTVKLTDNKEHSKTDDKQKTEVASEGKPPFPEILDRVSYLTREERKQLRPTYQQVRFRLRIFQE